MCNFASSSMGDASDGDDGDSPYIPPSLVREKREKYMAAVTHGRPETVIAVIGVIQTAEPIDGAVKGRPSLRPRKQERLAGPATAVMIMVIWLLSPQTARMAKFIVELMDGTLA